MRSYIAPAPHSSAFGKCISVKTMFTDMLLVASCALLFLLPTVPLAALAEGRAFRDVVFTDYGESSSNQEIVRRLLSPLAAARLAQELARPGRTTKAQPIDLSEERFVVYVPSQRLARGY